VLYEFLAFPSAVTGEAVFAIVFAKVNATSDVLVI
jgi:hypothetical protein